MGEKINIICWKWGTNKHIKKGIVYGPEYVNELYRMLKEKCSVPFQLYCITDDPDDVRDEVITIPLWDEYTDHGGCWVRLPVFDNRLADMLDIDRFISIDLDCVIVDDPAPIFQRNEDFVIYCEHHRNTPYCGAMFMMNIGCRSWVYDNFDFRNYPATGEGPRWSCGTDQLHISNCLYPNEAIWDESDGVYNFATSIFQKEHNHLFKPHKPRIRNGISPAKMKEYNAATIQSRKIASMIRNRYREEVNKPTKFYGELPDNSRIIFFNGRFDPANVRLRQLYPWIKNHYRLER